MILHNTSSPEYAERNGVAHDDHGEQHQEQDLEHDGDLSAVAVEEEPREPAFEPIEAEDDPFRLAREFERRHRSDDLPTLKYWGGEFLRWDGAAYRSLPDGEVRAETTKDVKRQFDLQHKAELEAWDARGVNGRGAGRVPVAKKVTRSLVANVQTALESLTLLPSGVRAPSWLPGAVGKAPADGFIACRNGLLHLPGATLLPNTPRFFTLNALDVTYDRQAPAPAQWLTFLGQLWGSDIQAMEALQEWFGYALVADTSQHKILFILGPRRSGKGTIARVLKALVGERNVCAPTLASLGTQFGLSPLLGKSLAFISDARLSNRSDVAQVVERLLSISGEDAQTIDRKHLPPLTTQLRTRFVILTNELPRLDDTAGSIVGRLVVLRLTRSWYGQEDTALTGKLLAELPGILNWAIDGWRRLQSRGRFVTPASSADVTQQFGDLASPVGAFVRDCCIVDPVREVRISTLFAAWRDWCVASGKQADAAGDEAGLGRDLRTIVPQLDTRQRRDGGTRVRSFVGVGLRGTGDG